MIREQRRLVVDGRVVVVDVVEGRADLGDGRIVDVSDYPHLPPCEPQTVVCVHLNFPDRLAELGRTQPLAATYFMKPARCLNGHGGSVVRPQGCKYLNYEGELAVVIGSTTRNVTPDTAADHILGYTIANDFGLHDFRDTDENAMVRVKGSDTLGAVGPGLVIGWEPAGKSLETRVNGTVVQNGKFDDLFWSPEVLIADLSRTMTFERGDLILTGTPANSRPVKLGDVVEVEVEGLGVLRNHIVEGAPLSTGWGAQPTDSEGVRMVALGSDYS
ncbi:fumarylacetoacetate hydrolase family protein [Micromonospora sp. NPDC005087]|uniref:fumarylacetoacetate hydrolase family protein n=1 Tax=Micromonospora sp. NPDC005087 TaxID=3364225 RepID=UPI0036B0B695